MHRPSLFAFSLASKTCHRAATFLIFRKISVMIQDREGLQRDAGRLVEALFRTDSARHVQSITIKGALRLNTKKTDIYNPDTRWLKKSGLAEILDDEELVDSGYRFVVYDEGVIKESSEEDMAWAPFVSLLEATNGLRDLIYDCQSQLPPSLLRALHEKHPLCRLHHLTFRFRTLLWGVPYPYEMELATSPSLYRVRVICTDQDSDGNFDYNMDAVMELAAGLAPNLKEVSIAEIVSQLASSRRSVQKLLWQGLPGFSGEVTGSLTSLSLYYCGTTAMLQNWAKHTDFDKLQHLVIGGGHERRTCGITGETMAWIARNNLFPNLKTLFVNLNRNDDYNEKPHYSENAISFFQAIDSLEELTINGPITPQMIEAVLIHHGPTLKKLSLEPSESMSNTRVRREITMEFTEDRMLQIQALCPVLEKLAITVMRDKSSASETAIYKCFGKMESLRSLFLTLDCANWRAGRDPTYDPRFEGEDQEVACNHSSIIKKGNVREALINSAVDEGLARSIWEMITQNKTGKRLERLKLWTRNGGVFPQAAQIMFLDRFAESMGRSWLIERSPRDDTEEVTVKELKQHAREDYEREHLGQVSPVVEQIFHSIWPRKQGSRDWRDDWSSFPLQG
ncbi:uncharacterized protein BDR25DRAFT_324040 [Lindgomyces ingoldianus]|uniref:Uncharacterized protein n=1 Tax=Lindgomyces ingoldianus TaxID=673940 RepID=A0ACB6R2K5_9PLEO|nr:uncharacterized protein BDR25DRAFT_324040 [Lindgomyces ingoldianus]KAF2472671.1 hypothetical protein BDR25DRAFT_324040 [Lindgomyces ingoldianus]